MITIHSKEVKKIMTDKTYENSTNFYLIDRKYRTTWKVGTTSMRRYSYEITPYPIGYKCLVEDSFGVRYVATCIGNMKLESEERHSCFMDPKILMVLDEGDKTKQKY